MSRSLVVITAGVLFRAGGRQYPNKQITLLQTSRQKFSLGSWLHAWYQSANRRSPRSPAIVYHSAYNPFTRYTLHSLIQAKTPAYLLKLSFTSVKGHIANLGPWLLANSWLFICTNQRSSFGSVFLEVGVCSEHTMEMPWYKERLLHHKVCKASINFNYPYI